MTNASTPHSLILGATKGIGFALADQLLDIGHRVTISGRDTAGLERALQRLRAQHSGAQISGLVLDLREHEAARIALAQSSAVDNLVLCGSSDVAWGPFATVGIEAVGRAVHMKVLGFLNAVQAVLPQLAPRGSITLVGGAASRAALPGTVGLAVVNGALEAATRTLARELSPRRVNLVSPGLTDTEAYDTMPADVKAAQFSAAAERLPAKRTGTAQEVAAAIAFALGNPYVTGSVVDVDGGAHLG